MKRFPLALFFTFVAKFTFGQCGFGVTVSTADTFLCTPSPVQLNAVTSGTVPSNATVGWSPASGLNNVLIPNPVATPTSSTTYTYSISSSIGSNLIINGDFENGNTNFTSNYTVGTGGTWGPVSNPGTYFITTSPNIAHSNFSSCPDHTPGTGVNMFVANGGASSALNIWCQTVAVTPNTDYVFSMWAISTVVGSPAQLFVTVNNTTVSGVTTLPNVTCQWQEITFIWNSGTATAANFCIRNQNTAGPGNDFALDDISLFEQCTVSDQVTLTVNNNLPTSQNATICAGDSIFLAGAWQTQAGVYNDILTDVNGCDSIIATTLSLTAYATNTAATICANDSIFLAGAWQTQAGFYDDTLQAFQDGCDSIITTELLVIPVNKPDLGPDVTLCEGSSITLTPTIPNATYAWSNGVNGGQIVISTPGTYIVTATNIVTNCQTRDTIVISAGNAPELSFGGDSVICSGGDATISAVSNVPVTYEWTDGSTNADLTVNQIGTYAVTVTDISNGCETSDSIIVTEGNIPIVDLGNDTTICQGEAVIFDATGQNRTYEWQDGSTNSTYTATASGTYAVIVTEGGCSAIATVEVSTENCGCTASVPNAFSPNGDNKNDYLRPLFDGCQVTTFNFRVFNRWGQPIFETTDPTTQGWDGRLNGVLQPQDNYVWTLTYTNPFDGTEEMLRGECLLLN